MDAESRAAHRRVPSSGDAHVQRLRRPGGEHVSRHGPAEELLTARSHFLLHPAVRVTVFLLCLIPFAHLALDWLNEFGVIEWWSSTLGAEQIAETEIRTGLWTLRFLAITLAVTPARQILGLSALAKYRRMLGLFAFFYAMIHVFTWSWADMDFDLGFMGREIAKHKYILIGMLTFVILIPLALTSTKGWIRRMGGRRWNRLHQLIYLAAVTGTVHYLWAVKKDTFFPLVYLVVFIALLGYRIARNLGQRRASGVTAGT
jgi:sulfoxide reductase heme-binding subunit YedZ